MNTWLEHVERWRDCTRCPLHTQRDNIVLARGVTPCDVLFIGEAPGTSEDALGLPFVGPAGHLLDEIIGLALPAGTRYAMTNLVACFPAEAKARGDNEPDHSEIVACGPRLREFMGIADPRIIVCVGSLATEYVTWDRTRGRCDVVHPAHILRMPLAQKQMASQKVVATLRNAVADMLK